MADRRIKDLTPQAALDTSFLVAVDKSGEAEATSVELVTIASLINTSVIRKGSLAMGVGIEYTVTFATAFSALTYSLIVTAFDSNGDSVALNVSSRGLTSFKVTASASCTMNYIAIAI